MRAPLSIDKRGHGGSKHRRFPPHLLKRVLCRLQQLEGVLHKLPLLCVYERLCVSRLMCHLQSDRSSCCTVGPCFIVGLTFLQLLEVCALFRSFLHLARPAAECLAPSVTHKSTITGPGHQKTIQSFDQIQSK